MNRYATAPTGPPQSQKKVQGTYFGFDGHIRDPLDGLHSAHDVKTDKAGGFPGATI
jgi:hypothetical protein